MRKSLAAMLAWLLVAMPLSSFAAPPETDEKPAAAEPAQSTPANPGTRPFQRRGNGFQQRAMAKPEWLDPNREEPNGTKYQTFKSDVLGGREVSYLVYLPPGYDEQSDKRYPVIYWLHGSGGSQRAAAMVFIPSIDAAIKDHSLPPAIVVGVNGMVNSFYCDWADGKQPVESVIIKDLVPHVDATYRTIAKREARLIEGYSMGGFGAGHLAFKYPDVFGSVAVNAGALVREEMLGGNFLATMFKDGFASDPKRFTAESPFALAEKNADQIRGRMNIRIGCGGDDGLLSRNRELHELLERLKIEHTYIVVPEVAHNGVAYYQKLGDGAFTFHRKIFESLTASK